MKTPKAPARPRITEMAPGGPPYVGFLCDLQTLQCLAAGVVNSRAEVNAKRALADYEAAILVQQDDEKDEDESARVDRERLSDRPLTAATNRR